MLSPEQNCYRSADSAWRGLVGEILSCGEVVPATADALSFGSRFGRKTLTSRELLATRTVIQNPGDRLIFSRLRKFRLDYAVAQVLWAFSKSDAVAPLAFYNPKGLSFSDDGRTIRSAIGPRIFGRGGVGQFHAALEKLRNDPSTRRAMIQIYLPSDLLEPTKDVACTGAIHFVARGGRLHSIVHMRSQSALMVFPYDIFLLTMIHEFASVCSGLELGTYLHLCDSAHIYEDELPHANSIVSEKASIQHPMPCMPPHSYDELATLLEAEQYVREVLTSRPHSKLRLEKFGLSKYWGDLLYVIAADWRLRSGSHWTDSECDLLPSCYQQCLRLAH